MYDATTQDDDSCLIVDDVKPMLSTLQSVLAATEMELANNEKNAADAAENVITIDDDDEEGDGDGNGNEGSANGNGNGNDNDNGNSDRTSLTPQPIICKEGTFDGSLQQHLQLQLSSPQHSLSDADSIHQDSLPQLLMSNDLKCSLLNVDNDSHSGQQLADFLGSNDNFATSSGLLSSNHQSQPSEITLNDCLETVVSNPQVDPQASSSSSSTSSSSTSTSTSSSRGPIVVYSSPGCALRGKSSSNNSKSRQMFSLSASRSSAAQLNRLQRQQAIRLRQQQQSLISPSATPSSSTTGAAVALGDDWFNDEDMLFARIVGLRLKKMDPSRRKLVRTRIMDILDEDIDQEMTETVTSVTE